MPSLARLPNSHSDTRRLEDCRGPLQLNRVDNRPSSHSIMTNHTSSLVTGIRCQATTCVAFSVRRKYNPKNECWWGVDKQGAVGHGKWNGGHSSMMPSLARLSTSHSDTRRLEDCRGQLQLNRVNNRPSSHSIMTNHTSSLVTGIQCQATTCVAFSVRRKYNPKNECGGEWTNKALWDTESGTAGIHSMMPSLARLSTSHSDTRRLEDCRGQLQLNRSTTDLRVIPS